MSASSDHTAKVWRIDLGICIYTFNEPEDQVWSAAFRSAGKEVWLVFPESRWIIIATQSQRIVFIFGEVISTQIVLPGFNMSVDDLLA